MKPQDKSFERLQIRRKEVVEPTGGSYRIYKNAREFIVVKADTAQQAIEVSGLKDILKVEPNRLEADNVLKENVLGAPQEATPAVSANPEEPAKAS